MKKKRESRRLSQTQMAKILNVSPSAYAMYEQGVRECAHDTLIKIANTLNTTADFLLGISDNPRKPAAKTYNYRIEEEGTPIELAVITAVRDFGLSNDEIIQLILELKHKKDRNSGSRK